MTVGVVFLTVGVYFFKIPNGFVTGGVSGIGTVLGKALPILSSATWIAVINILLLVIGFIFVGKETGIRTAYCSLAFSFFSMILEKIVPISAPLTSQPFLELIYAIILTAAGSAIMFSQSASSGGTDIVALIVKKFSGIQIGTALLITDVLIVVVGGILSKLSIFISSFIGLLVKTLGINLVIFIIKKLIKIKEAAGTAC